MYNSSQELSDDIIPEWVDWSVAGVPGAAVPLFTLPVTTDAVNGVPGSINAGELHAWVVGAMAGVVVPAGWWSLSQWSLSLQSYHQQLLQHQCLREIS